MQCSRFAKILADFLEGTLSIPERTAAARHLEGCPSCRDLLAIARGDANILPQKEREDFVLAILDRTSGSACPRVQSNLWDCAGGDLRSEESQLVTLHLDHCSGCRMLAEDLSELREVLPSISEIEPEQSFTGEVVARTSGRRRYHFDLGTRMHAWWNQVVQRPLFSLEAAYLATLLLFFAFSPILPLRDIARNKIPSAAIYPSAKYIVSVWVEAKVPASKKIQRLSSSVAWSNQSVAESLGEFARRSEHAAAGLMNGSLQGVQDWRREGTADLLAFWQRVSDWTPRK
jgi:predicted anti-sigma-YlaC factor YlaD